MLTGATTQQTNRMNPYLNSFLGLISYIKPIVCYLLSDLYIINRNFQSWPVYNSSCIDISLGPSSKKRNITKRWTSIPSRPKILLAIRDGKEHSLAVFKQDLKIHVEAKMDGPHRLLSPQCSIGLKRKIKTYWTTWTKKILVGRRSGKIFLYGKDSQNL